MEPASKNGEVGIVPRFGGWRYFRRQVASSGYFTFEETSPDFINKYAVYSFAGTLLGAGGYYPE